MAKERLNLHLDADSALPLREEVFQTLRNAILRGHLLPGARLMEIHLAAELGVSRTPVREAIQMLAKDGLAEILPRRGARVAGISGKDLEDVLEIRSVLEDLAVRDACKKMTPEQFDELDRAMRAFAEAAKARDERQAAEADERFHDAIYRASGNERLAAIIASLREQMFRYRYEYIRDAAVYEQLVKEHAAIADALRRKNEKDVRRIMRTHLENQVEAMRGIIREGAAKKSGRVTP